MTSHRERQNGRKIEPYQTRLHRARQLLDERTEDRRAHRDVAALYHALDSVLTLAELNMPMTPDGSFGLARFGMATEIERLVTIALEGGDA